MATPTEFTQKGDFLKSTLSRQFIVLQAQTSYCQPCKAISPIFDDLASSFGSDDFLFARFDIDVVPDLAFELGAATVPAFYFFQDGDKMDSVHGANAEALKKTVQEYAQKAADYSKQQK